MVKSNIAHAFAADGRSCVQVVCEFLMKCSIVFGPKSADKFILGEHMKVRVFSKN